jgi:hypothetical protein
VAHASPVADGQALVARALPVTRDGGSFVSLALPLPERCAFGRHSQFHENVILSEGRP